MSHRDEDDVASLASWAAADGSQERDRYDAADVADDEAAEAVLQRLGRDRLLGIWRSAVGCVGASLRRAEAIADAVPEAPVARSAPRAWGRAAAANRGPED